MLKLCCFGDVDMVVASVGEDKKISLWQKNGKTLGSVPKNSNDINEVTTFLRIFSISLSFVAFHCKQC